MRNKPAIILGLLAVAGGSAGGWYYWQTNRPESLLIQARAAIDKSDRRDAERLAAILEQRGEKEAAHFIRGKASYAEGQEFIERASVAGRWDSTELLLLTLLDAGGASIHPLHAPVLFHSCRSGLRVGSPAAGEQWRPWLRERLEFETRARTSWDQAIQQLGQIGEDSPLFTEGAVLAGKCFSKFGEFFYGLRDFKQATALFNMAVKKDRDNIDAHRWLGVIHFDQGSMFPALDHLEAVSRLDPEDGRPYRFMALIHKDYSKVGEAIAEYQEALKRTLKPPVVAEVVRELGELQAGQGQYEAAMETLKKCPAEFAGRPELQSVRAECLFYGLQQHDEAIKLVDAALRANSDLPHTLLLRARIYLDVGKHREAIPLLEKCLRIDPFDEKSLEKMAQAYTGIGDAKKAEEFGKRRDEAEKLKTLLTDQNAAAMSKPWDDKLRVQIAETWLKMNKRPEAIIWLEAALTSNPNNEDAKRILKELTAK